VSDAWVDQSITAFRIPALSGQSDASFVITHDASRGSQPFEKYAAAQQAQCKKSLPGFRLVRSEIMQAHDRTMCWLEFTWENNGKSVQIRQIQFDMEPMALICTLTAAPVDIPKLDLRWQAVMGTLRSKTDTAPKFVPDDSR
jgi:hypothetical protein